MGAADSERASLKAQIAAWLVHLYTASGGVVGMFALLAAAGGEVRLAFILLGVAALIDASDGILARRVRVGAALPRFSGTRLDDVIDVLTFVWVPVFIMASQDLLPHPLWIAVPVLAALYAYGQVDMKTDDAFFLGFPSCWNLIALYLFWLRPEPAVAALVVVVPGVLSFVPTRYLYPSKNALLWKTSWTLGLLWAALVFYLLMQPAPDLRLVWLSLIYPVYYLVASFIVDWRLRQMKRRSRLSAIGD